MTLTPSSALFDKALVSSSSSVNDTSAMSPYAVLAAPDSTAFSVSPSPWWTACMTLTPSSALFDKALVSSSSAYLSVLFDAKYPNATLMDEAWKPPWPFLENRAQCMTTRDPHGAYNHGLHHGWHSANCYTFLCELIIGFLLNPEWRECWASVLMAIAVCTISLLRPPSIILLTRLVLATTVCMVNKYMQVVVRTILFTGFIVTSIFGTVGYYVTRTAITIIYRLILVAWSPVTTATLLACRIILLSHGILRFLAVALIASYYPLIIIPLEATAMHVNQLSKLTPKLYTLAIRRVIGTWASEIAILENHPQRSKRRPSMRARYLAMRLVVDDVSSAATFSYVLLVTLFNGILHSALNANCRLHRQAMNAVLLAKPLRYVENLAVAASYHIHQHRSMSYVSATVRQMTTTAFPTMLIACVALIDVISAGSSDDDKRGPPKFSGEKTTFVGWFMLMSAYIAWKLHASASIFEEMRSPPPSPPAPIFGRMAPRPPDAPAPVLNADGITIDNQADIVAAATVMASWIASPLVSVNADAIKKAQNAAIDFLEDNVRLYGLIVQSLPAWLVTSVYNSHRNDGLGTVKYLRAAFDARGGDSGDHAAQLAKLQLRYIDGRNTLSTDDVRKQFDAMMTAVSAIERTGNPRPNDLTLIAMYESSLPQAYSQIRQLTRRAGHSSFLDYHMDVMSQVSAELTASAPAIHAFQGIGRRVGGTNNPPPSSSSGSGANPCVQCGTTGHMRPNCTSNPVKCTGCGAPNHLEVFCTKGSGIRRNELTPNGQKLIDRDVKSPKKGRPPHAAAPSYAAAAASRNLPVAPPALSAPSAAALPPVALQSDPAVLAQAHAAAVHAAQGYADPLSAINAYAGAMRALGHGFCAMSRFPSPSVKSASRPNGSLLNALVDTMATYWIVGSVDLLWSVSAESPGYAVETANGPVAVQALGVALVWMLVGDAWECYEVPNVLVLPGCPATLYSTRIMRELFGLSHDTDNNRIGVPGRPDIKINNDGSSYSIPVVFATSNTKRPRRVICPSSSPTLAALLSTLAAFPVGISGTTQATLHHRLGFPYADQWRHVPASTTGHGLPPNARVSVDLPVREAILRGRARAAKWHSAVSNHAQPPPAAMFYMDFAGPLMPSIFNKFVCYAGVVDAGSGYGRLFPCHGMTADAARMALETFTADIAARMGFHGTFKPLVVRSDQGSAFISSHFREFLLTHQIKQSLAAVYTPQQNSHIERFWGVVFGTARVLLAAANLPPSFHAFALQTAAWIHNRLPRPSLGNASPFFVLSRSHPALDDLYTFGCLASITIPVPKRDGDRHFADRGEYVLYLGPSEVSPAHVVYLLSSKRITAVPKLRVWEDEFPGIKGERYDWFSDLGVDEIMHHPNTPALAGQPPTTITFTTPTEIPAVPLPPDTPAVLPSGVTYASPSGGAFSPPILPTPRTQLAPPSPVPMQPMYVAPTTQEQTIAPRGGHGGHADTDPRLNDPHSRHFLRPQRPARAARDNHPHGHSQYNRATLAQSMALFASLSMAFSTIFNGPPPRPAFAFESNASDISPLFFPYDSELPEGNLAHVAERAAAAFSVTLTVDMGSVTIPKSYRQAINGPHAPYWKESIAKELGGLIALHTWDLLRADSMPDGANIMHCHFVFAVKRKSDGSIEKFKARLVADGNTQKEGIDFDRIFATVVKTSTIRLLLIIAAAHDYNLSSIDIRQAYLQAELTGDLFMRCPPGVWPFDSQHRPMVCKLRRSLYGLKQAGREWALLFASFLLTWPTWWPTSSTPARMQRSTIDSCLFTFFDPDSISFLAIAVYVDDALIVDNDPTLRDRFVHDLSERFPTEDKGPLVWILNVAIERDRSARSLTLSQSLYVSDLLTKHGHWAGMAVSHDVDCPLEEGTTLSSVDQPTIDSPEYDDMAPRREAYMSIVGGLLWLANMTMPHLAYPASQLSRFLTNPGPSHFAACIRVLVYLRSVPNQVLRFTPNATRLLDTFVDSNWATKFSCSGSLVFFYGCLFHWFSKMQHSVSLSSAEAEYFGAMMAARELMWIRDLLFDLGIMLNGPSVIYSDSRSAILMAFDPIAFKKTKHILRSAEFLRDSVAKEIVTLQHVAGKANIADILTKAVNRAVYFELMRLLASYAITGVASM